MDESTLIANSNDYATAKVLNGCVARLTNLVFVTNYLNLPENSELDNLNRVYVLLVHELQQLYSQNSTLSSIEPKPIWHHFDMLERSVTAIGSHLSDHKNDTLQVHIAKVNRLCIITGNDTPKLSAGQVRLIAEIELYANKYTEIVDKTIALNRIKAEANWHIVNYTLTYKPDGSILINNVLKLKKTHAGSMTELLMEQAIKNPDTLFKPTLGQTSRNLSTILSSAGFTPTLRKLFFPTVSKSKGIIFRPIVTREQADSDGIDSTELDVQLKALGADTESGR